MKTYSITLVFYGSLIEKKLIAKTRLISELFLLLFNPSMVLFSCFFQLKTLQDFLSNNI